MRALFITLLVLGCGAALAAGPTIPNGAPTLNQAQYGAALVKSDTIVFPATRGLHIGDATACNLSVVFVGNPGITVVLDNVQPGLSYSYQIVQLMAATTCTDIVGLW